MAKLYDVAVKTGEYTNTEGAVKNRYENVGVILKGDNGPYLLLKRTFNPAGTPNPANKDTVLISLFKPKTNNEPQTETPSEESW